MTERPVFVTGGVRMIPGARCLDGLYETNSRLRQRGAQKRFVIEDSLYQRAKLHPAVAAGILLGGLTFLDGRRAHLWEESMKDRKTTEEPKADETAGKGKPDWVDQPRPTPGQAEGDRETVEEDLREKQGTEQNEKGADV
jgi:hypothetical protein